MPGRRNQGPVILAGQGGGVAISAGTQLASTGTAVFTDGGGVSFGMEGSSLVSASVRTDYQSSGNYLTTAQPVGAYLTTAMLSNAATISNIKWSAGTQSTNASAFTMADGGGLSWGLNAGTITGTVRTDYQSAGAYLTTAMLSNAATISNIKMSAGAVSTNASAFTFDNAGGVSFGLTNNVFTASAPAAAASPVNFSAGTTSGNLGSVVFSNSNGVSFGLNGSTITASTSGGAVPVMSFFENLYPLVNTQTLVAQSSSMYLCPVEIGENVSMAFIRFPVTMSLASTTGATGAAGYTRDMSQGNTLSFALYTLGTGANSLSFNTVHSTSATWAFSIHMTGTASTHGVSYNISWPMSSTAQAVTQMLSNQQSSAINEVPAATSNFQSYRYLDCVWPTSISAGNYWAGFMRKSATDSVGIGLNVSFLAVSQHNSSIAPMGSTSHSSQGLVLGLGSVSTNNTTAMPMEFNVSNVSTVASHLRGPYFQMIRIA